jgi:signal transduction histidine kinase
MKRVLVLVALLILICRICYGQLDNIKQIQKQLPHIHDSLRYVDAFNRLGMLSYENNLDSSFYYTSKARNISDRLQYAKGKADATNNLGIIFDMRGNLQLALRYYNDAYNRYQEIHDTANMVQATMNIAMVYEEIGKDQKAINSYKRAIVMGKGLGRDSIMSLVLYNYTLQFPESIPRDSILIYISKATQIATKYKDKRVLLAIEQLTADYYIKNDQRDKGIALLQHATDSTLKSNLYYLSLDMLIELGDQFAVTDSAKAVNYYKQGLSITSQKGYGVYNSVIIRRLYNFYIDRKDNATAFYYSRRLLELNDEQERTDNNSGVDYIEYALKDQQLDSAHVQSTYQQIFLILTGVICLITIASLLTLWRNWKRLNRTADALRLQFQQSELTMEALDIMNKDYARVIKIVAHDLRNPIGGISAIANMVQTDGTLSAEARELMNLLQESSKNCLELINELMETDFDQYKNFKKESIDIDELLQQCVRLLSFRAKDKNQQIVLNTNLQVIIQGDREKLWRVMNNLIINSSKFSPAGSEIHIDTKQMQDKILIIVKDTGMGIPDIIKKKIFDPFTTAKRKGTQGEQPYGLGLYISKQIIEAHNGKIWFKSEEDMGTEFYIELPINGTTQAPPLTLFDSHNISLM